jgi:hypothetical protein
MKLIRERRTQDNHSDSELEACFKKLQAARDEYGPLEEEYDALEDDLDRDEYEVTELEEQVLKHEQSIPGSRDSDIDSLWGSSNAGISETPEAIKEEPHPIYEEYMSRLGDADLCREEHSDLVHEYDRLLEAQLKHIETDVERLRLECIREGILDEGGGGDSDERISERQVEDEGDDETNILATANGEVDPGQAEYNTYPVLLPEPSEIEEEKKTQSLISEFRTGDTGNRITRWMLHKLKSSYS